MRFSLFWISTSIKFWFSQFFNSLFWHPNDAVADSFFLPSFLLFVLIKVMLVFWRLRAWNFINILEPCLEPLHHRHVTFTVHILLMTEAFLTLICITKSFTQMIYIRGAWYAYYFYKLHLSAIYTCSSRLALLHQECASEWCIPLGSGSWLDFAILGDSLQVMFKKELSLVQKLERNNQMQCISFNPKMWQQSVDGHGWKVWHSSRASPIK